MLTNSSMSTIIKLNKMEQYETIQRHNLLPN